MSRLDCFATKTTENTKGRQACFDFATKTTKDAKAAKGRLDCFATKTTKVAKKYSVPVFVFFAVFVANKFLLPDRRCV